MERGFFLRVTFVITISILLLIIVFNLNQNNKKSVEEKKEVVQEEVENSNLIKDVEYKSKDSNDNLYILKASEGIIDQSNSKIIYLTSIKAVIELNDYNSIDISSNFDR
jgi:hypothetical protein